MNAKAKILVVEDESVTALDISGKLKEMGYTVTAIIDNGDEVIDYVEGERPDLALLDINLKGECDGVSIAERLRNEHNIPVIFLTAFADRETVKRAIQTSPYGYIVKPVGEIELRTTIEVALHKYQVEKQLRESEERYRSLYSMLRLMADNVPDMIWVKDLDGKYLFVNKAICELLLNAESTEEPIGKNDMFFASRERDSHPDPDWHTFGELCVNSDEAVIKSRKPGRFDEYGNVQGEFIFLDVYKAPFWDENGKMIGTVGSARIVTEEKILEKERSEAEAKLRQSEEAYHGIFDNAMDAIYIQDREGRFIDVNEGAISMYGYPKEFFVGKTPEPLAAPGLNDMEQIAGYIEEAFKGEPQQFEFWAKRANGEIFPKIVRLFRGRYFGQDAVIAFALDISEIKNAEKALRQNEERYRVLFSSSNDAVLVHGITGDGELGKFVEVNEVACNRYGYSKEELLELSPKDINSDPDEVDYAGIIRDLQKHGSAIIETIHKSKNGESINVEINARTFELGGNTYVLSAIRDVTERKRAEDSLLELRQAKDTLTDLVVHDIKNISSAMLAWLEILRDGVLGELTQEQQDALHRVIQSNEELFGLSEEMLDIASAEEGEFDLQKKPYVFDDQIREVVEQYRPTASTEDKVIRFRTSKAPVVIYGDEYRVKRAISNILTNALKFTTPGNGMVFVTVRADEKTGYAILRISDNGPGILKEYHQRIFEKYGQAELKGVGVKKGKGLGLTFCKIVAEAHGGSIEVESDGESGSAFIFKLPLYKQTN